MSTPYSPPTGTAPGLVPYAETLPLCDCPACVAKRPNHRDAVVRLLTAAEKWRKARP